MRKDVFITTKSTKRTRKGAEEELRLSLKRLKTDYVDLWQIHAVGEMDEVDQIFGPGGAIEAFEAAKKAGACRFIGFTGHRDPNVHMAMLDRYDDYDTILMPLHPADPAYLSFESMVLPEARKRGLGIQGMKSLANAKSAAVPKRQAMHPVRPEPADPLPGCRLYDDRPDRGRRADRA